MNGACLPRPAPAQRVGHGVVFDDLPQRRGERALVVHGHDARRVAHDLGERGAGGRDERRAARERFERGHAEALLERGVRHRLRLPVQRRNDVVVDVTGAHDVGRDTAVRDRGADLVDAPSVAADEREPQVGVIVGERRERGDEGGHVLPGFERADERDVRRGDPVARPAGRGPRRHRRPVRNRSWSTPCRATVTRPRGGAIAASRHAVNSDTQTISVARRALALIMRRK